MKYDTLLKNIPSFIKVSKDTGYEIVWVDNFKDSFTVGETRFNPNQIALKTEQSAKETVHTLYHEFLHALSDAYNVNLTEKQVKALEKSLYFTIEFVNILTKGENYEKSKSRSHKRKRNLT